MLTREERNFRVMGHIIMTLLSLMAVIPIILMVISSFTDNAALLQDGYSFFPKVFSTYAYEWVFKSNGGTVIQAYVMSFFVTAVGTTCSL